MEGYNIQLDWDDEAKVWMATSEDIPGLILEDESADKLIQRVILAAPEIIELNGLEKRQDFYFNCDRYEISRNKKFPAQSNGDFFSSIVVVGKISNFVAET